jgi:predicted DNA binding CopG/RHH family protein
MENNGWIKIHRKLLDWEWKTKPNVLALFIHLLLCANHKENKWNDVLVKRGELITGRKELSKNTGLSEQQTRSALICLKSTKDITIKTTNKYSVITINKYNQYQQFNQQLNQQITNKQPTNNQQITTNNNDKNDKNVRIYINKYPKLTSIEEKDFEEIADKYQVPLSFVRSKFEDMELWAGSMPNNKKIKGRNWRLTLMGFVKKDSLQLRKEASLHESKRGIDARNIT